MKRKAIVGMSLKNYMNTNVKTAEFCRNIRQLTGNETAVEQFLFPSLGAIPAAQAELQHQSNISYGAQNIAPGQNGAYTGEYSIESMLELGGSYVELGHNERIQIFHETPELINQKTRLTLENNCTPVLCIGEGNQQLSMADFTAVLTQQLQAYLHKIAPADISRIIFAYEPGWAIGKAEAAPTAFVHQAHREIRTILATLYNQEVAVASRIIYGGSVSKENTGAIIKGADVDGVFIGRFGHQPQNYQAILELVKAGGRLDDN
ncbi:triose-phosphate isomerase family protein [Enterococcus sp. LJL90]